MKLIEIHSDLQGKVRSSGFAQLQDGDAGDMELIKLIAIQVVVVDVEIDVKGDNSVVVVCFVH